jgi:hypothetical protein
MFHRITNHPDRLGPIRHEPMMRHHRQFVVCLLCAWVLWATSEDLSDFLPAGGFETREQCEQTASDKNKAALAQRDEEIRRNLRVGADGKLTTMARSMTGHYCLPDTVDPRGPKR